MRFILNFHGIGTPSRELSPSEHPVWLEQLRFESFLNFARVQNGLALTFDDGNESDYTIVLPALVTRGMKAQFFIVFGNVGRPGYLSRDQIESLRAAGMSIGNHGLRHRPWASLTERELEEELVEARDRLEQLAGVKIRQASCPFGSYNRRVVRAVQDAGYERLYTSDAGPAHPGSLLQPRNGVYRTHSLDTIKQMLSDNGTPARRLLGNLKMTLKRWR